MKIDTAYATESDADAVTAVLTSAFGADALAAWLFPDPERRPAYQDGFYRSFIAHPQAECALAADGAGAAVWIRLAAGEPLHAETAGPTAGPLARLAAVGAALDARHPLDRDHLYLPLMGVAAGRQGQGIGSALLREGLARADRAGLPAYLEASSPQSRALYLRHGFADLGLPVRVEDSPEIQPMWREAAETNH
ncbi:GNAT family N-acetyltransferase [Glycomyces sp. NPDC047010]|uniref:GNAT family N-acetyltransferase n=1 Tax=Glycomyces sp. NPDC047010 TaxID=3155023 RepID=UPI0033F71FCD